VALADAELGVVVVLLDEHVVVEPVHGEGDAHAAVVLVAEVAAVGALGIGAKQRRPERQPRRIAELGGGELDRRVDVDRVRSRLPAAFGRRGEPGAPLERRLQAAAS
jgi:hypothetical protein